MTAKEKHLADALRILIALGMPRAHQMVDAGIALYNPDSPQRPVNSPKAVYQISPQALELIKLYGTAQWARSLKAYLGASKTLAEQYAAARSQHQVPVTIAKGKRIQLTAGDHSELIKAIIDDFAPRFAPGSTLVYAGGTGAKWGYFDEKLLLVESVTSHCPVDGKRHGELAKLFGESTAGLVYVTAFPNRQIMGRYLGEIAWETEVWVANAPSHLIHFNGLRFLGPYGGKPR